MKTETVIHPFPPIFDKNSRVLILGSLPSPKSREINMYYGNPQNRFWRVLAAVYGANLPETNDDKRSFVLSRGIALWDVIKSCTIAGASDASIKNAVPNDFDEVFSACDIKAVFTVGKTAHALFERFYGKSFYLPSPSGANCAVGFDTLVKEYSVIKNYT